MELSAPRGSNPKAMLSSILNKRQKLQEELRNIEKQVFDLETTYLQETGSFGNALRGFEGFLSSSNKSSSLKRSRKFQLEDRLFSLSSVTSPAQWMYSLKTPRISSIEDFLIEENLVPINFALTGRKIKIIRWNKPVKGMKLNTDASFIPGKAMGGAIMRSNSGSMLFGIRFPVEASSPLEAELRAILYATRWAVKHGFNEFQVESDSTQAISFLLGVETRKWMKEIQETLLILGNRKISFRHIWRESNWTAHFIAEGLVTGPDVTLLFAYVRLKSLDLGEKREKWIMVKVVLRQGA